MTDKTPARPLAIDLLDEVDAIRALRRSSLVVHQQTAEEWTIEAIERLQKMDYSDDQIRDLILKGITEADISRLSEGMVELNNKMDKLIKLTERKPERTNH